MAYAKIILNGETLMDVTSDTVNSDNLLSGETATRNSGAKVTGNLVPVTDVQVDGTSVVSNGIAIVSLSGKADASHTHNAVDITDLPTIPTITLNGSATTSPSFYAPTSAGTSGYYLKSNGSGAPTWASVPAGVTVTLNGSSTTTPSFYAPTSAGTSGYVLTSSGSGAPSWSSAVLTDENVKSNPVTAASTIILVGSDTSSSTTGKLRKHDSAYIYVTADSSTGGSTSLRLGNTTATSSAGGKEGQIQLYGTTTDYYVVLKAGAPSANRTITFPNAGGTIALTSDIPTVPTITLNGSANTSPSFYAPTSNGSANKILLGKGGNNSPVWSNATISAAPGISGDMSYIGQEYLTLGNNIAHGQSQAMRATLLLYGTGTSYTTLRAAGGSNTITLPSSTGTVALTSDVTKVQIVRW